VYRDNPCPGETTHTEAPVSDIALVLRAAEFAAHKHRNQQRKGSSHRPYIGHCIEVARILAEAGKVEDANVLAAALLHDTVEDTDTTRDELREQFGPVIDDLVAEVTDDKTLPSQQRKDAQEAHAPHISAGAKVIKLADKISNVREIGVDPPETWDVKRRQEYFAWAARVVAAVGSINPELERLFASTLDTSTRILLAQTAED